MEFRGFQLRANTVELAQCQPELRSPVRQTKAAELLGLYTDRLLEAAVIHLRAIEIVGTGMELKIAGFRKDPLEGLGLGLNLLETCLLRSTAAIGVIPVTVVKLSSTLLPGNAPVGNLVQGAGKIIQPKHQPVQRVFTVSWKIDRLRALPKQAGLATTPELLVKHAAQIAGMMLAASFTINREPIVWHSTPTATL